MKIRIINEGLTIDKVVTYKEFLIIVDNIFIKEALPKIENDLRLRNFSIVGGYIFEGVKDEEEN